MEIIDDDAERANIQFVKIKDDHDDFDGSVWENTWILDSTLFKFDIMPSKDMEIIDDDAERANIQFVKINDKRLGKSFGIKKFPALTMIRFLSKTNYSKSSQNWFLNFKSFQPNTHSTRSI